jgi:hypothetical protein
MREVLKEAACAEMKIIIDPTKPTDKKARQTLAGDHIIREISLFFPNYWRQSLLINGSCNTPLVLDRPTKLSVGYSSLVGAIL